LAKPATSGQKTAGAIGSANRRGLSIELVRSAFWFEGFLTRSR
jgi:hypothetical protein